MDVGRGSDGAPVVLSGMLDVRSVAAVREMLQHALDHGAGDLVVDLSRLDGMDAAGLGVLVGLHRRAQRVDRRLVLRGARSTVLRTLAVTRLHRVLHLERLLPA